jgi:hypothetical protein
LVALSHTINCASVKLEQCLLVSLHTSPPLPSLLPDRNVSMIPFSGLYLLYIMTSVHFLLLKLLLITLLYHGILVYIVFGVHHGMQTSAHELEDGQVTQAYGRALTARSKVS